MNTKHKFTVISIYMMYVYVPLLVAVSDMFPTCNTVPDGLSSPTYKKINSFNYNPL